MGRDDLRPFARPNGLFIAHFGWPRSRVSKAMRYYLMSIGLIVPLIMALITSITSTIASSPPRGPPCFMLICGALAMVTLSLKRAGIPLYLDKEGSGDNMLNRLLGICCSARADSDAGGGDRLSRHVAGAARQA